MLLSLSDLLVYVKLVLHQEVVLKSPYNFKDPKIRLKSDHGTLLNRRFSNDWSKNDEEPEITNQLSC